MWLIKSPAPPTAQIREEAEKTAGQGGAQLLVLRPEEGVGVKNQATWVAWKSPERPQNILPRPSRA